MSIGSCRAEFLVEAERYRDLAGRTEGPRRLNLLMQARDHYLSGGQVGKARAIERVVTREGRASLGMTAK